MCRVSKIRKIMRGSHVQRGVEASARDTNDGCEGLERSAARAVEQSP